ncbi:Zinc finger, GRF-type [Sesbania bispinosa]|nr:Zinc finger, GRF-type [Sesbania bispinosa]
MKGKASASEKRTGSSKCSSSSSTSRRLLCGCGEEVCLLRSNSDKNPGRFFWRCRNWDKEMTCNYFRWADHEKTEKSSSLDEAEASVQREANELKKKVMKLQRKLWVERLKVKAAICVVILSIVMTIAVCVTAGLNCKG